MRNISFTFKETTTQLFIKAAKKWSDKIRWQVPTQLGWVPVTWKTYNHKVFQIAAWLHKHGLKYPDKAGILAPNSIEWIYCALGVMASNSVLVPIYFGNTIQQSLYIINHSDSTLLFLDSPESLNQLAAHGLSNTKVTIIILLSGSSDDCPISIPTYSLSEVFKEGENYLNTYSGLISDLANKPSLDDIAYMIYTSGTTGKPKGVPLSHLNLSTSTWDWISVNGSLIPDNSIDLHWLPNAHIYGWGAIGLGNIFGFQSYLATPQNILTLLPEIKPHIFMSVPTFFEKLYLDAIQYSKSREEQLNKLRKATGNRLHFLLSGGAKLKREVKEFFLSAGMWITEGYGLSECSPTLTMNHRNAYNFDSVGLPFPSVQLKLASDGEILAKGDNVFSGYYKDPKATHDAFTPDGWFKTGDIGVWLDGGYLKIIDRKKDIIVTSGGKNIPPQKIERKFAENPFIEHLILYGNEQKYLVALITLNEFFTTQWANQQGLSTSNWKKLAYSPQVTNEIKKAIESVNQSLASFETIKYFGILSDHFTIENGLLTAALKIRRKTIYQRYKKQFQALYKN